MVTRISNLQVNDMLTNYIAETTSKYNELSVEAASGKKLTKASDNPTAAVNILKTEASLGKLNGYLSNMKVSQNELDTVDSTLSALTDNVQNANDLATQAANGTYNPNDLKGIKTQINSILDSVVDLANTQYNGKYLFSGAATSEKTYSVKYDASGNITDINYNGTDTSTDAYKRYVTISDGVNVAINAPGDQVFGSYSTSTTTTVSTSTDVTTTTTTSTTDATGNTVTTVTSVVVDKDTGNTTTTTKKAVGVLGNLVLLSNSLGNGDTAGISNSLDSFTNSLNVISANRTQLASVSNRFEITESSTNSTVTQLTSYKSDLENVDLTQVLSDLATQETALKATYQVASTVMGMSLLNYL